ncbi:MAG: perosamine synthetase [Candidatus Eremiobacteraeota bacterium]|jgi:dTDP-4-amino-4,6-dideoxygalactose transaminase|nr:perosamine synthetase [Candidatus Eremiobacteraeota bacterium]
MSTRHIAPHPRAPLALLARAPSPVMDRMFMPTLSRATAPALAPTPLLYRYSRYALHAFFTALGAPRGTPVWMPSFHCGMEVRNAADAGFTPRFYHIGDDLAVDEHDLARGLRDAPGPVLLIHYFGFAQPGVERIAALCAAAGAPLVEDCAHAPLSTLRGRALGTVAPAATFSFSKTFGTVDGGSLRIDAPTLARITGRDVAMLRRNIAAAAPRAGPPIAWDAQRDDVRRRSRDEPPRGDDPERVHAALAERFAQRVGTAQRNIFQGEVRYGGGMSRLSATLLRRCDPELVMERRRANYQRLDALLHGAPGYHPLCGELPDGACPLYLPAFVHDRTAVLLRLQAARIAPFIFGMFHHPAMDAARFPATRRLRENLLCLPVHQDLGARDVERIAAVLRPLLAGQDGAAAKDALSEGASHARHDDQVGAER